MKREEFAEYVYLDCKEGITMSKDEFINVFLKDLDSLSLPPAEGAETIQPHITCPKCGSTNNSELAKNDRLCYDCNHSWSEPQPTAEGAEEALYGYEQFYDDHFGLSVPKKDAIQAMNEFATLHAQRLADKMVSERLREELIAFDTWENGDEFSVETVDEYLKSRGAR